MKNDEFLGWGNEYDLTTVQRKMFILAGVFEKVEVAEAQDNNPHERTLSAVFKRR